MLQAIRERVTGLVAIFILGLLAIPFLFFGVESYVRDVPQNTVATVGDAEITVTEYQTEFARYRAQMRSRMGDDYNDLEINRPESRREFLESMIEERLLEQHARDLGLTISPNALVEVVRQVPAFQVDGEFSSEMYRQQLRASGQSPRQFEENLRQDLLLREIPAAVSASTLVTESEVDRWLRIQMETRDVRMVTVESAPFVDPDAVTDEEIQAHYEDNQGAFMRPERVTVEYAELDTREMAADMEISEDELRQRYEAVQSRYLTPERRRASHILIEITDERDSGEARQQAEALREELAEGADFATLAREHSDDIGSRNTGGDLGWIEPDVMDEAFEEALFGLEPGTVSDPVRTSFGWHLIRLAEVDPPRGMRFEEARPEIVEDMRAEEADDLYYELSERLVDLIYADPGSLEPIAEDLGLELDTLGPFTRDSGEGLAEDPRIRQAAFSDLVLGDRQTSELIELERGHAVVLRVVEHEPATPRPLEAVADEIRQSIARERAREQARERAREIIAAAREDGSDLESAAADADLEVEEMTISRRDFQLGSQLLDGIFRLPAPGEGEAAMHLVRRGSGWAAVHLESVTPGDPAAADEARRRSARQQIRMTRQGQEVAGLVEWLRANTEIRVVEERLN